MLRRSDGARPGSGVGQKRHGLFVGYWGEAATGRGPD
jgi:hypothetical protein